eukprot:m.229263 g.229263  ORF g.229263 m.229263 type:complete len:253 (-) comp17711_c0_seq1:69-827(-)
MAHLSRKRCLMYGCSGWEFASGLCRIHANAKPELCAAIEAYKEKPPLQEGLIVTQVVPSEHYIALEEGDKVAVLDVLSDNQSVIVRRADGGIGYFNINFLTTEEEILAQYQKEQSQASIIQQRQAEEAARQAELEYEQKMRHNMLAVAEADKQRRAMEVEQRKRDAEARLQAEIARQQAEAEARRVAEEKLRAARAEQARKQAELEAQRLAEAHKNRQQWDEQEQRRQDAKLQSLPQWQQNLIANKRRQGNA